MEKDRLDVRQHIEGISQFICSCDTPMTIAIQGDWGTGKTSFINLIDEELTTGKATRFNAKCIQFNTWQFSQFNLGNELPILLISALVRKLNHDDSGDTLKKMCSGLSLVAQAGSAYIKNQVGVDLQQLLVGSQDNMGLIPVIENLKANFEACVNTTLEKSGKEKIVVFIDDLDRLDPKVAVEILEILKVFLDCKNCIFVLAIDQQIINIGVEQKYGDLFKDKEKCKNFFDKIIQVPYKMPVSLYKIDRYLEKSLEDMNFKGDNVERYKELISKSIGYNPRGIKRVFNAFLMLTYIYPDKDLDTNEMNRLMLFATLCLQLSYEDVYTYILENRKDVGNGEWFNSILVDVESNDFLMGLKQTSDAEQSTTYTKTIEYLKVLVNIIKDNEPVIKDNERVITDKQVAKLYDILETASTASSIPTNKTRSSNNPLMLDNILSVIQDVREHKNDGKPISKQLSEAFVRVGRAKNIKSTSVSSALTRGKLKLDSTSNVAEKIEELMIAFDNDSDFTQCELYKRLDAAYGERCSLIDYFKEIKGL